MRFAYIQYDESSQAKQATVRTLCESLETFVENNIKDGRCKATALTKLEEVHAWLNKGIKNDQLAREALTGAVAKPARTPRKKA